jgi:hypothetical protein
MVIKPYTGLYKGHNRLSREIYNKFGLRLTVGVAQFDKTARPAEGG